MITTTTPTAPIIPDGAKELILLAVLERREFQARTLRDRVARICTERQLAGDSLDCEDEHWRHGAYCRWSEAWEALNDARQAMMTAQTEGAA